MAALYRSKKHINYYPKKKRFGYASKFTDNQNKEWLEKLRKQDFRCVYCGRKVFLTVDHIIPLSLGGKHNIRNMQGVCRDCNLKKGDLTDEEYRAKIAVQPRGVEEMVDVQPTRVLDVWEKLGRCVSSYLRKMFR